MSRIGLALVLACAAAAANAQMYRWVDKDGKVHYTDTPPPSAAKSVQKRAMDPGPGDVPQGSYDLQQAVKSNPVVLYTSESCGGPCNDAKALLAKRGVPFREIVVGDDATREALKQTSGAMEVPVMALGREVKRGYEPDMYNAALDAAGYPKSAPPLTQAAPKPKATPKPPAVEAKAEDTGKGRYQPQAAPDAPSAEPTKGRYLPQ